MDKYGWSRLNHLQLGRYAEYYSEMEFALFGYDVYSSNVDDKGIDFVVRKEANKYYDVQVKSVRNFNYIFFQKEKFKLRDNLIAVVVLFDDGELPKLYLIPSTTWFKPTAPFVSRDYRRAGSKSKPEWGLCLSQKNLPSLARFAFDKMIQIL